MDMSIFVGKYQNILWYIVSKQILITVRDFKVSTYFARHNLLKKYLFRKG